MYLLYTIQSTFVHSALPPLLSLAVNLNRFQCQELAAVALWLPLGWEVKILLLGYCWGGKSVRCVQAAGSQQQYYKIKKTCHRRCNLKMVLWS
jgi:hypothetical protein